MIFRTTLSTKQTYFLRRVWVCVHAVVVTVVDAFNLFGLLLVMRATTLAHTHICTCVYEHVCECVRSIYCIRNAVVVAVGRLLLGAVLKDQTQQINIFE